MPEWKEEIEDTVQKLGQPCSVDYYNEHTEKEREIEKHSKREREKRESEWLNERERIKEKREKVSE